MAKGFFINHSLIPLHDASIAGIFGSKFFSACNTFAGEVVFAQTAHDFGSIAGGLCQPAQFSFVNNTDAPTIILNIQASRTVKAQYQRGYIRPGQSSSIAIKIESQTLGAFSETVHVYFSHTDQPYSLKLTGNMVTAAECFPDKSNWEIREIRIVDSETKELIPDADAQFSPHTSKTISLRTQADGRKLAQLPIGLYHVEAHASDYIPLSYERHIRKTEPIIYIEMQPSQALQPALPPAEPKQSEEIPPVAEDDTDSILPASRYVQNNIVFLIDISLSMKKNGKIQRVQQSIHGLIDALRPTDSIGIVVYNNTAQTLASQLSGADKAELHSTVDGLVPAGLTNGVAGLQMAYQLAAQSLNDAGNNQILLITDGEFTAYGQSASELENVIVHHAQQNIKLSILSFGEDRDAIAGLKRIAKKGAGNYLEFTNLHHINIVLEEIKQQSLK